MNENARTSEVLIPIPLDRRETCDRRKFIAGASAALAAVALSSRLRPIMAKSNRSGILSPSNIGAFNRVAGPGK
jgi:hypothetical protein